MEEGDAVKPPGGPVALPQRVVVVDMAKWSLNVSKDQTVRELKEFLAPLIELAPEEQAFIYGGKVLDSDNAVLADVCQDVEAAIFVRYCRMGSGPSGGVGVLVHSGVWTNPAPTLSRDDHRCVSYDFVRWQTFARAAPWPHKDPVAVWMDKARLGKLQCCGGPYAQSYLDARVVVVRLDTQEVVVEAKPLDNDMLFLFPTGGEQKEWQRKTRYALKIFAPTQEARGFAVEFTTD